VPLIHSGCDELILLGKGFFLRIIREGFRSKLFPVCGVLMLLATALLPCFAYLSSTSATGTTTAVAVESDVLLVAEAWPPLCRRWSPAAHARSLARTRNVTTHCVQGPALTNRCQWSERTRLAAASEMFVSLATSKASNCLNFLSARRNTRVSADIRPRVLACCSITTRAYA
jgi:hypothetical protein